MNKKFLIFGIAFLLIFVGLSGCLKPEININNLEMKIHNLVNEERIKNGITPLEYNNNLANIARFHSQDMANRNFFSHYNPEGQGPTERAIAAGYYTDGIGENICMDNLLESGYSICFIPLNDWKDEDELAQSVVDNWMGSIDHRQNILSSMYYWEGIGVAIASNDEVYVTQDFE